MDINTYASAEWISDLVIMSQEDREKHNVSIRRSLRKEWRWLESGWAISSAGSKH